MPKTLFSLADLIEGRRKERSRAQPRQPKICCFCGATWLPKTGNAQRSRLYCYKPECERDQEFEHARKMRERSRLKARKLRRDGSPL
jgi:hypothetical protein